MIEFKLKDTLNKHRISANKLAVESKVRSNTIYDIVNGKAPTVSFETLTAIIGTLRELTGDNQIDVTDVFKFKGD